MRGTTAIAIVSAAAAFAAAVWYYKPVTRPVDAATTGFDDSRPVAERIAVLEQAVAEERAARQLLQEEVLVLTATIDSLSAQQGPADTGTAGAVSPEDSPPVPPGRPWREFDRRGSPEERADRLVATGFSRAQAERILRREEELQMEALEARYEAGRSGDPADFFRSSFESGNALRQELGDEDYARYLAANGRPTSVSVSSVIDISPAATAGLRPGDRITAYDGQRVFSIVDVNLVAMEGESGQNVIIDIERDGVPMQLVVPRGPLGITSGRRSR